MTDLKRLFGSEVGLKSRDLVKSPMVFLTGPRQVGKTYSVRKLSPHYYNWDTKEVKTSYLRDPYFFSTPGNWVIFDEIHKRRDWKQLLKGYYDSPTRADNYIVTGSGRFNIYKKGGDSLQGRYDLYHLYPMTQDELSGRSRPASDRDFRRWTPRPGTSGEWQDLLLRFGGFPAPLLAQSERSLNKWSDLYIERLIEEDARDFSRVVLLDKIELLARLLPGRVGSPLSQQSLSEDLEVSRDAIATWLRLFEVLYFGFQLSPFHHRIERAVKKEKKWFFFQWTFVEDPGSRFENYLATQLLTATRYWRDQGLGVYELHYLRDQDRREVDFVITRNLKPVALIEAKSSPQPFPTALSFYSKRLNVPAFLIYPEGPTKKHDLGYSMPAHTFLNGLVST